MTKRDSTIAMTATAAAAGFALAIATRRRKPRGVSAYRARVARVMTVRRDAASAYGLWREAFPTFFRGVSALDVGANGREHWTLERGKSRRAIEVVVVDEQPGERIEWHSDRFGRYAAHGLVTFEDVGKRGSEVHFSLALDGPPAKTNAAFARLLGMSPTQIATESLRDFKALAEAGEIPKAVRE